MHVLLLVRSTLIDPLSSRVHVLQWIVERVRKTIKDKTDCDVEARLELFYVG